MSFPDDDDLYAPAFSVARGFEAYGRYGREEKKALAALRRRAPAFSEEERREVFEAFVRIYQLAREAVAANAQPRGGRRTTRHWAAFEDVDAAECMRRLDTIVPGQAMGAKRQILNWSIMYYYLK
ncbi:MAG: hypothetical protein KAI47_15820 [Deltaproteobacteria bacterium]|nr:hypothetical protein [Deltaproteobacteria bacterium]